jgi:hypothetical protein
MTRWASENQAAVLDDKDNGEWDDIGQCPNCDHGGITGT